MRPLVDYLIKHISTANEVVLFLPCHTDTPFKGAKFVASLSDRASRHAPSLFTGPSSAVALVCSSQAVSGTLYNNERDSVFAYGVDRSIRAISQEIQYHGSTVANGHSPIGFDG